MNAHKDNALRKKSEVVESELEIPLREVEGSGYFHDMTGIVAGDAPETTATAADTDVRQPGDPNLPGDEECLWEIFHSDPCE
jgi:hypothetical protein